MPKKANPGRQQLIKDLNDDLAREYQAIIAYVVYSQTLKGAAYMANAAELEKHAAEKNWRTLSSSPSTSTIWVRSHGDSSRRQADRRRDWR
jgi:hypothetical protein